MLSDDIDIAECMNDYFINITETLNIRKWPGDNSNNQNEDIVNKAIFKYKNHPSIKMIMDKLGEVDNKFEFQQILPEIVYKQVKQLDASKSSSGKIPTKIIKDTIDLCKPIDRLFKCIYL